MRPLPLAQSDVASGEWKECRMFLYVTTYMRTLIIKKIRITIFLNRLFSYKKTLNRVMYNRAAFQLCMD